MRFSSFFYRGIRFLCKPFVKLDRKIEYKQEEKARKRAKLAAENVLAYTCNNEKDSFFEKINVISF